MFCKVTKWLTWLFQNTKIKVKYCWEVLKILKLKWLWQYKHFINLHRLKVKVKKLSSKLLIIYLMGTMTCCPRTFSVCLLSCCFQTCLFICVSDQQQYWQRKGHKERKQQSARCEEKRKNGEETGGGGAEQQPQVTGKHTKQKKMSSKTYFMYSLCVCASV